MPKDCPTDQCSAGPEEGRDTGFNRSVESTPKENHNRMADR